MEREINQNILKHKRENKKGGARITLLLKKDETKY